MPETRTAISTDRLGIARQNVSYLKLSIPEREFPFRDVEVIGLGPVRRLRGFLYELEQEGFRPVRIHGATGIGQGEANIRRLMLGVFSRMVVPTKTLTEGISEVSVSGACAGSIAHWRILRGRWQAR